MFSLTTPLSFNGQADRYHKNLAAIRLLRQLQTSGYRPETLTDEQRHTLAHYSAFGESALLIRALNDNDLDVLLSEADKNAIARASLTAFYTSPEVLHVLWGALAPALRAMQGPIRMLEPAFGVGMFVATMPQDIRQRSEITAVELDRVSSEIAGYLHPDVQLYGGQGFEETELPDASFDLVVGNVPFGDLPVFDPRISEPILKRTIHDYFVARSIHLTRPGGLVAILTSYGTLDKRDNRFRKWLAQRAELVTAIRLPQGVFSENAGTQCGADLLILRRLSTNQSSTVEASWIETEMHEHPVVDDPHGHFTTGSRLDTPADDNSAKLRMSRHFVQHPQLVIGQIGIVRSHGYLWQAVIPPTDRAVPDVLAGILAGVSVSFAFSTVPADHQATITQSPQQVVVRTDRIMRLLSLYTAAKHVLRLDIEGSNADTARAELNAVYDAFVAEYGVVHSRANQQALRGEPELLFLQALETDVRTEQGIVSVQKAPIFKEPTIRPAPHVTVGKMTPDEALLCCLDAWGHIDLPYITQLCGQSEAETVAALQGRIYRVPGPELQYVTADEYLSGNIRVKLRTAQEWAALDDTFADNARALEAVEPPALTPGQIRVKFGAPWVPLEVVTAFISSLLPRFQSGGSYAKGTVMYHRPLAKWVINDKAGSSYSHEATVVWGTNRVDAIELIEKGLNGVMPVVYDTLKDDSRVVNQKATLLAREKLERIKERWEQWVWEDPERTTLLCRIYNEQFNAVRRRDFDGSHLSLQGINTTILRNGDLAKHQKDAVWMILQRQTVLLDLCVGAGKTFICLAAAHELKRLGLANKVLITVPNHLVEQWAAEANRLYPGMRVLAMSSDDFSKQRRGTFLARIATEVWDVIICAHTSFGMIEPGRAAQSFIKHEVETLKAYLSASKAEYGEHDRAQKRSRKEIERKIAALEVRLKEREYGMAHDSGRIITWDELGIDALFVDEAHEFKNLAVPTMLGNLPGVPKGDSKRAFDMRIKTWDLIGRGGRVVFATGTPVLNTLGEVFIMQKYLQEDVLNAHGIEQFDAWARTFAEAQTVFEMTPDGGGFRMNTRLCKFVNLPELFSLWFQFTFSRSKEQLGLPTPTLVTGKPIPVTVPGSPALKKIVQDLVARVERIKSGDVEPWEDNMLTVTSDGRKAALDVRLVGGQEEPVNKINALVARVAELYHRYDAAKATQIIFCELSTPKP